MSTNPSLELFLEHIQLQQSFSDEELKQFTLSCATPLRKSIRANTHKISIQELSRICQKWNWENQTVPWCDYGVWIEQSSGDNNSMLGNVVEHLQGLFYIQEASSMLPAQALKYFAPGAKLILDVAAAPGSKTTQLSQLYPNSTIVANELSSSRLKSLHANTQRCGVDNVILTHLNGNVFGKSTTKFFDAILLDAPCGGEGTLRKDPDALNNWSTNALTDISVIQKELIDSAYQALKPGGYLIYSTCTLSKEENQIVIDHLINSTDAKIVSLIDLFPDAKKCVTTEGYLHVFPHIYDSEGFFVAAIKKPDESYTSSDEEMHNKNHKNSWPFKPASNKQTQQITKLLTDHFGFQDTRITNNLWIKDTLLWWFPEYTVNLAESLKIKRSGIKIAEIHKDQINLHHEFAICHGRRFNKGTIEVSAEDAKSFIQGRDLSANDQATVGQEHLITFNQHPLGMTKALKNKLKNRLPRPVVRDNPIVL
ncbi:MAG: NOL1/NOP2/sun family putative RNA methylase [Gammaproteobacteria bacterium]|nr:NOL1/NOP2/sun family putative RNA methylase [Gammaproteobacteria bacterium]